MELRPNLNRILFFLVCLTPIILAFFWALEFHWALGLLSLLFLALSLLCFIKNSRPLGLLLVLIGLGGVILLVNPLPRISPASDATFRIHSIRESTAQIRLVLESTKGRHKSLAIFYKPKIGRKAPISGYYKGIGKISEVRETKTQVRAIIKTEEGFIRLIFRKKNLSDEEKRILLTDQHSSIVFEIPRGRFLRSVKPRQNSPTSPIYEGYPESFSLADPETPAELFFRDLSKFPIGSLNIGDIVRPTLKTSWKVVRPFRNPKYLFAQGFRFQGQIVWIEKLLLPPVPTFTERIVIHLSSLYNTSSYGGFYQSVILAKNTLDKKIYKLFQRNELVHLLVISGAHVEMIISFLMLLLTTIFALLYIMKNPKQWKPYLQELRFFRVKTRSRPIFLILCLILFIYLGVTDSPQAGARAIFGFLLMGLFFQSGLKTSVFVPFCLSIALCFLVYPEWITYPLGLFYSSTAVFSLYFCLPLTLRILANVKNRLLYWVLLSILLSTFVSVFIAPISFYLFHYYNFLSIFTNIVMGGLFTLFMYIASLASLVSFLFSPLAELLLVLSDACISLMIYFLNLTDHIHFLKFYISSFSLVNFVLVYLGLWILLRDIKNRYRVIGMTT